MPSLWVRNMRMTPLLAPAQSLLRPPSSEGLTRLEDTPLHSWRDHAGCWNCGVAPQTAWVWGSLGVLTTWLTAGFRQSRSKGEQTAICFTILLQKSYPVFSTIPDWLSRSPLVCVGREYTRAWIPGGRITREHLGVRWPQGSKIIPISQQSKLRHRKVSPFSQRHAADVWRSWDVNPGLLWSSTTQRQCWSLDND